MVITGAPNLSNEAWVRGEVRSVSERESDVWGMTMRSYGSSECGQRVGAAGREEEMGFMLPL